MSYSHFTPFERGKISQLLDLHYSHNEIAKRLHRHRSSIDREIKRNSCEGLYNPETAQELSNIRFSYTGRKSKHKAYTRTIKKYIKLKWSPEQIANTALKGKASFSSIYRWVYEGKIKGITHENLRHKGKRIKLKGDKRTLRFAHGKPIKSIPKNQRKRSYFGHWELDTVLPSRGESKTCLATFVERKSRFYICVKIANRTKESMFKAIKQIIEKFPQKVFKLFTCDRGSEFLCAQKVEEELHIPVYFTDAFCAWQKGTNENSNGLLREFFPKKTNFDEVLESEINKALKLMNSRPRKCLNWKTPQQVFNYEVAHLN